MDDHVKKRLLDSNYVDSYQPGLGAIKKQHREKIMINNSRNLQGSMDVDKSCKDSEPNSPRWDYLVVILKNNQENLALIEIHGAAKPKNAKEMIKKKAWLNQWLINVRLVDFKKKIFWIAANGVFILPQSRYAKELAKSGIPLPKRVTPYLDTEVEYF